MSYKGKFKPKNLEKYVGDTSDICFRSLWERSIMKWCDSNEDVVKWGSEVVVVPYFDRVQNKHRRYFVDFYIKMKSGQTLLVECKPEKHAKDPSKSGKKVKLSEAVKYLNNSDKWVAAEKYANERKWVFQVWTEKTLNSMGIKTITPSRKRFSPKKNGKGKSTG